MMQLGHPLLSIFSLKRNQQVAFFKAQVLQINN